MGVEWVVVLVGVGASTEWDSQSLSVGVLIIASRVKGKIRALLIGFMPFIIHGSKTSE
jgi:hypothetical protein